MSEFKIEKQERTSDDFGLAETESFRTASNFSVIVNIVCAMAGTGILGLSYALKNSGWLGLGLIVICSLMEIYTGRLQIECLYYKPGERLEEYSDIGEAAFGKLGKNFVKIFQYSASLSFACIYILLAGLNVHQLFIKYNGFDVLPLEAWIIISGVIVWIPFVALKTLKEVAWLSVFGALCTIVVVIAVIIQGGFQYSEASYVIPHYIPFDIYGLPIAFATIAFSFTGNVVFPHIEATMKYPQAWNKVMSISIGFVTFLYIITAISGYFYYGDMVLSPVLDSLPAGVGSFIGYILITLHVLLAAPIFLCSFALEQENLLNFTAFSPRKEFIARFILRTIILVILTLIAMFLPFFSDLMSLFGAVSGALVVFIIPVTCHYKLFGWRHRSILQHIWASLVIIVGVLGLTLGSKSAIENLISSINGTNDPNRPLH